MQVKALEQKYWAGLVQVKAVGLVRINGDDGGFDCILGKSFSFVDTYMEMTQALKPSSVDFNANAASPFASELMLVVGS